MTYVVVCFIAPLVLLALSVGAGLLVDRVAQGLVPGALLPALGFAMLVTVGQLTTGIIGAIAPATPHVILVVGVIGLWMGRSRLRSSKPDWVLVSLALLAYAIALGPVLASFRPTLPGYLLDTTVGIHLAGAKQLLVDGRDFSYLPSSALRGSLISYFGSSYPSGIQVVLGSLGKITFQQELIWLYQPFLALIVAMGTPVLYCLARAARAGRWLALAAAALASAPALAYAYLQMGAIKEIGVTPIILLIGALLPLAPKMVRAGPGAIAPLAVAFAGGLGAIGLSFAPWVIAASAFFAVVAVLAVRRRELAVRALGITAIVSVVGFLLLALPTVVGFANSLSLATSLSQSNTAAASDPGNLLHPLEAIQIFGVWLNGTHRVPPGGTNLTLTHILVALMALGFVLGMVHLVRRRRWSMLLFAAASLVLWVILTARGTTWIDAKLLVITSPVVVLFSVVGAQLLAEIPWRRAGLGLAAALVVVLGVGVYASAAKTYHATYLAPTERYRDLAKIADEYQGRGRVLVPDFDEYALSVLGSRLPPDGPSLNFRSAKVKLNPGNRFAYGTFTSLDQFTLGSLQSYRTIVTRTSPEQVRPPSTFRLARSSPWYNVWTRRGGPRPAARAIPVVPSTPIACRSIRGVARKAQGGVLRSAPSAPLRPVTLLRSPNVPGQFIDQAGGFLFGTPGRLDGRFSVPRSGSYRIWLKGDFLRRLTVSVDGKTVGSISGQAGGDRNYATALKARIARGPHTFRISRPSGSLYPGDGGTSRLYGVLVQAGNPYPAMQTVAASRWRSLCGRRLDWVEAVRR